MTPHVPLVPTALAAALLLMVPGAGAQRPAVCPPAPRQAADTTVFLPCHLDRAPVADPSNAPPRLAEILRSANVSGFVRARFVIDTAGRPEMHTFKAPSSAHELFTTAVRSALSRWRFTPGLRGGRAVRVTLELEVVFEIAEHEDTVPGVSILVEKGVTADGVPRLHRQWRPAERDTTAAFDRRTEVAIYAAALAAVMPGLPTDSAGLAQRICVGAFRGASEWVAPDSAFVAALARLQLRVVSPQGCWRNLVAVVRQPDAPGRSVTLSPAGPAPYVVTASNLRPWNADAALVEVNRRHRRHGTEYRCRVERSGPDWKAVCRSTGVSISSH